MDTFLSNLLQFHQIKTCIQREYYYNLFCSLSSAVGDIILSHHLQLTLVFFSWAELQMI